MILACKVCKSKKGEGFGYWRTCSVCERRHYCAQCHHVKCQAREETLEECDCMWCRKHLFFRATEQLKISKRAKKALLEAKETPKETFSEVVLRLCKIEFDDGEYHEN